jgi:hypothetical protein
LNLGKSDHDDGWLLARHHCPQAPGLECRIG